MKKSVVQDAMLEMDSLIASFGAQKSSVDQLTTEMVFKAHEGNPYVINVYDLPLDGILPINAILREASILTSGGNEFKAMLYRYRSLSRALPMTGTENDEAKIQIYLAIYKSMEPYMTQFVSMKAYHSRLCAFIVKTLGSLHDNAELQTDSVIACIVEVLDCTLTLDTLKDAKACVKNDVSFYKRAIHMCKEKIEDYDSCRSTLEKLQDFFANAKCPRGYLMNEVLETLRSHKKPSQLLNTVLEWCAAFVLGEKYQSPEQLWRTVRVMCLLVFLLDEMSVTNVFKSKKSTNNKVAQVLSQYPVVPLYGDMQFPLEFLLTRCAHYDANCFWIADMKSPTAIGTYNLLNYWSQIQEEYDLLSQNISRILRRTCSKLTLHQIFTIQSTSDDAVNSILLDDVVAICRQAMQTLCKWKELALRVVSYKLEKPAFAPNTGDTFSEYETRVLLNFSDNEREVLVRIITMCKSISAQLRSEEGIVSLALRMSINRVVQNFLRRDLTEMQIKAEGKKRTELCQILMKIRGVAADWGDGIVPSNNAIKQTVRKDQQSSGRSIFSVLKSKSGDTLPALVEIERAVSTSPSQLMILKSALEIITIQSSNSKKPYANKYWDKSETEAMLQFLDFLRYVPDLLDLSKTLTDLSSFGYLWLREFYIDISKQVQFSVENSQPWILIQHLMNDQRVDPSESLVYAWDLYNDAANEVLCNLKCEHLFLELEAEVEVVCELFVKLVSNHMYAIHKNTAATSHMDPDINISSMGTLTNLTLLGHNHYCQKLIKGNRVSILGRPVNFGDMIAQSLMAMIQGDVTFIIEYFESRPLQYAVWLEKQMQVVRACHRSLSLIAGYDLNDFESLVANCNQGASLHAHGRIAQHILDELQEDIIPNYSLDSCAIRFVLRAEPNDEICRRPVPKGLDIYGFGKLFPIFEPDQERLNGFFGVEHLLAIVKLIGGYSACNIFEDLLAGILLTLDRISEVTLRSDMKSGDTLQLSGDAHQMFFQTKSSVETMMDESFSRLDLFQWFREIGNGMAMIFQLQRALNAHDSKNFIQVAPLSILPEVDEEKNVDTPLLRAWKSLGREKSSLKLHNVFRHVSNSCSEMALETKVFNVVLGRIKERIAYLENYNENVSFMAVCSFVQFTMCLSDESESKMETSYIHQYGDGVLWTGAVLIHLLGQSDLFAYHDYSIKIHEASRKSKSESTELNAFSKRISYCIDLSEIVRTIIDGQYIETQIAQLPVNQYHPPRNYFYEGAEYFADSADSSFNSKEYSSKSFDNKAV